MSDNTCPYCGRYSKGGALHRKCAVEWQRDDAKGFESYRKGACCGCTLVILAGIAFLVFAALDGIDLKNVKSLDDLGEQMDERQARREASEAKQEAAIGSVYENIVFGKRGEFRKVKLDEITGTGVYLIDLHDTRYPDHRIFIHWPDVPETLREEWGYVE